MLPNIDRFPEPLESQFRAARMEAQAEINGSTFWIVAALVMVFSWWDLYVDPANWWPAFVTRSIGALVVLASGLTQRITKRVDWAPTLAKIRFTASVVAVAGSLSFLERGYQVGLAGLVAVMLAGPYIAVDRRDLIIMNIPALVVIGFIMYAADLDTFTVVNSTIFLALSVAVSLLLARVFESTNRRAFALEQELKREARTDALTGLRNRRSLEETATTELKRAARNKTTLSVVLLDIDHFKGINDKHGHEGGDQVIKAVATQLRMVARESDALGRWGGEEFLVILPDTDEPSAVVLAERMRAIVEKAPMPIEGLRVTISLGAAGLELSKIPDVARWHQVLRAADRAMYRAKAAGRNCVIAAHSG